MTLYFNLDLRIIVLVLIKISSVIQKMTKGKKKGKGKKGKKKDKVEPDFCDDKHFDEDLNVLYIDYSLECPLFKTRAQELYTKLCEHFPEKKIKFLENQPKKGSFEVQIARNCRLPAKLLWTGTDREPRESKFPNNDQDLNSILEKVKNILEK